MIGLTSVDLLAFHADSIPDGALVIFLAVVFIAIFPFSLLLLRLLYRLAKWIEGSPTDPEKDPPEKVGP